MRNGANGSLAMAENRNDLEIEIPERFFGSKLLKK
jgi:hypothetical protein